MLFPIGVPELHSVPEHVPKGLLGGNGAWAFSLKLLHFTLKSHLPSHHNPSVSVWGGCPCTFSKDDKLWIGSTVSRQLSCYVFVKCCMCMFVYQYIRYKFSNSHHWPLCDVQHTRSHSMSLRLWLLDRQSTGHISDILYMFLFLDWLPKFSHSGPSEEESRPQAEGGNDVRSGP